MIGGRAAAAAAAVVLAPVLRRSAGRRLVHALQVAHPPRVFVPPPVPPARLPPLARRFPPVMASATGGAISTSAAARTAAPAPAPAPVAAAAATPALDPLAEVVSETVRPPRPESPTAAVERSTEGQTFYRRPLPDTLVPFACDKGKEIFKRALQGPYMEGYFGLAGNFMTQAEPAYCGLSCLAMVLNTLEVDPGRRWKGVWRWYSEDMLDCCAPLDRVKEQGITFEEFACLGRCNGLQISSYHADTVTKDQFMEGLKSTCASTDRILVVSYSRKTLRQTGDGHFSPIGGYDPDTNSVLVLDVARFKYPSYWVSADLLWESLHPVDNVTGRARGYFVVSKGVAAPPSISLLRLRLDQLRWAPLVSELCAKTVGAKSATELVRIVLQTLRDNGGIPVEFRHAGRDLAGPGLEREVAQEALQLCIDISSHPLYRIVYDTLLSLESSPPREGTGEMDMLASVATAFFLALPTWVYPVTVAQHLSVYQKEEALPSARLRDEIGRMRHQMASLETYVQCACNRPGSQCTSRRGGFSGQ